MNIESNNQTLVVSSVKEITAANAVATKAAIKDSIKPEHNQVDLELSETSFIDSSGLGVLISLHKEMSSRKGVLRIISPTDSVNQILELTRLHRLFEIVRL